MYPGSEDRNTPAPEPRPVLALAAAAAERTLKLVVDGRITLETINADKERTGYLIKAGQNPHTGKRSVGKIAFSEDLWGQTIEDYLYNIKKLKSSDLNAIINATRAYSKAVDNLDDDEETVTLEPPLAERSARARIQLGYGNESDNEKDNNSDTEDSEVEEQSVKKGIHTVSDRNKERELSPMDEDEEFEEANDPYASDTYNYSLQANNIDDDDGHTQYSNIGEDDMDFGPQAQHTSQEEFEYYEYNVRILHISLPVS